MSARPWLKRLLFAGLLGCAAALGLALGRFGCGARPGAPGVVVRERPTVIQAIADLARLETVQFHMERVIDMTDTQRRLFGLVEADDSLLLVAAGDVTAGVDLEELRPEDVEIASGRDGIRVTLPRARMLASRLDSERTYVYARSTDLLAKRRESLEAEARRHAEQALAEAALDAGILTRAERNAERTVESLLRSLGHRDVEVRTRSSHVE
jgi:hypothetical protein